MRNTIVLLLIALAYAFASERDYQDAALVAAQGAVSRAPQAGWTPEAPGERTVAWRWAPPR